MRITPTAAILGLLLTVCVLPAALAGKVIDHGRYGDVDKVNGDIEIGKQSEAGNLDTVNGDIEVDDGSTVGEMETVNGSIELGNTVTAKSAETVNGSIRGKTGTRIDGPVETVNGSVNLDNGSDVREVSTVNGDITLEGTRVARDIETVNGDVRLSGNSNVEGTVTFSKPSGWGWFNNSKKPKLIIAAGVTVNKVVLEREVELQIDAAAKVGTIDRRYESN